MMQYTDGRNIMDTLAKGKHVFDVEIEALKKTRDALDDTYLKILDFIINCEGKVIKIGRAHV